MKTTSDRLLHDFGLESLLSLSTVNWKASEHKLQMVSIAHSRPFLRGWVEILEPWQEINEEIP